MKMSTPLPFVSALSLVIGCASTASAQFGITPPAHPISASGLVYAGQFVDNIFVPQTGSSLTVSPVVPPPLNLGTFDIAIVPGAALSSNGAALAAFNRAAQAWESRISDPITVLISANLASLGSNVLGSASSVLLQGAYAAVRNPLVADAADEADDGIVAFMPVGLFPATVPNGVTLSTDAFINKANAKALGIPGIDQLGGSFDGTITFSSDFAFDFDRSNGIGAGLFDFESVALHEIGHILGFSSMVDSVDNGAISAGPTTLDFFRFANNTATDPSTSAEFSTFARSLVPGVNAVTDQITGAIPEWGMSTGSSGNFPGSDGRQASHWKDADLTGLFIGAMDPTIGPGQIFLPTEADFRAFDLIGYDIAPVPEVSTALFGMCALLGGFARRRRARA